MSGNIYEVKQVTLDLMTVCKGEVNEAFVSELKKVVDTLKSGQKADISLKFTIEKPLQSNTQMSIKADIKTSLPKKPFGDYVTIGENNELLTPKASEKVESANLFEDAPKVGVSPNGNAYDIVTGEVVGK